MPAVIQQQYDALQQCLYVLRRAHLTGRPDEPAKALAAVGLLDMGGVQFEDPLVICSGLEPWLVYMEVPLTSSPPPCAWFDSFGAIVCCHFLLSRNCSFMWCLLRTLALGALVQGLREAGAWSQVDNLWADVSQDRSALTFFGALVCYYLAFIPF